MSERVITKITPADKNALIKNDVIRTAERFKQHGERFDATTPYYERPIRVWWQNALLLRGAASGNVYFGRPGTFNRGSDIYEHGILLSILDSIKSGSIVAHTIEPSPPEIEIGAYWRPIDEPVAELLVMNGLHLRQVDTAMPPELSDLATDTRMDTFDERLRAAFPDDFKLTALQERLGEVAQGGAWKLATKALQADQERLRLAYAA